MCLKLLRPQFVLLPFVISIIAGCASSPSLSPSQDTGIPSTQPKVSIPITSKDIEHGGMAKSQQSSALSLEPEPIDKTAKEPSLEPEPVDKSATEPSLEPEPVTGPEFIATPEQRQSPTRTETVAVDVTLAITSEAESNANEAQEIYVPDFDLTDLPITIAGVWTLAVNQDHCELAAKPVAIDDSAGGTQLQLKLIPESWLLETQSNIDLTYPDLGIWLDKKQFFSLEQVVDETNILIQKNYDQLINQLKQSTEMRVTLGFWPTWPATEAHSAILDIHYFEQAHTAWQKCNQLVSVFLPD